LWAHLPPVRDAADPQQVVVAGQVMLHAVDDVVASLAEGYQLARGALVRAQVSARREFVDDLLHGGSDVSALLLRATGFGLDLSGPHAVATVRTARPIDDTDPLIPAAERAIRGRKGDAHPLLASKDGRLVVVFAAPDRDAMSHVVDRLRGALGARRIGAWQLGLGRSGVGADGVLASYRESVQALALAERIALDTPVIDARDLLVYQVLLRDRAALVDLVGETLTPLRAARGGAEPLLATLEAYFRAGGNAARCAREMHLSVRAVTYRLDRVRELTGLDVDEADDRFTLHVATLGARLLDW
jgi:sugar diacid utilization regulator